MRKKKLENDVIFIIIFLILAVIITAFLSFKDFDASKLKAQVISSLFRVEIAKIGTGQGTVISNSIGINCGSKCSSNFSSPSFLRININPDSNSVLTSYKTKWDSSPESINICSSPDIGCWVDVQFTDTYHNPDRMKVTANFECKNKRELAVAVTVGGKIISSPAGINCGTDCKESYCYGSRITLTAVPAAGYELDGWDYVSCTAPSCPITMDGPKAARANFIKSSCQNECTASGVRRCVETAKYQVCGNYDLDSCLEWGTSRSCSVSTACGYSMGRVNAPRCTSKQRPSWYCTGTGVCNYTCYASPTCY